MDLTTAHPWAWEKPHPIAAFERPRQILSCLHSLLIQTHQNFELLVIHAGPGPAVKAAVESVGDPRVRFYESPWNPGHFGNLSRVHGMQFATGDWIGQTNDDNYYAPVYFEWMLSALIANEAQFVYCNMIHSYCQWHPFETYPTPGRIDAGGWICHSEIVKRTPWKTTHLSTSDGEYAEALAQQCKVVKVDGFLFVHN